jgi:hypothetical protein
MTNYKGEKPRNLRTKTAKHLIQRRLPRSLIHKGFGEVLPTGVQKSYFMLSDAERAVLNTALAKYRPGQSEPILVGGKREQIMRSFHGSLRFM